MANDYDLLRGEISELRKELSDHSSSFRAVSIGWVFAFIGLGLMITSIFFMVWCRY